MWPVILQALIVTDLLINLFFHLIQLHRYCLQQNALYTLCNRFGIIESRIGDVHIRTRDLQQSLSERSLRREVHIIPAEEESKAD